MIFSRSQEQRREPILNRSPFQTQTIFDHLTGHPHRGKKQLIRLHMRIEASQMRMSLKLVDRLFPVDGADFAAQDISVSSIPDDQQDRIGFQQALLTFAMDISDAMRSKSLFFFFNSESCLS